MGWIGTMVEYHGSVGTDSHSIIFTSCGGHLRHLGRKSRDERFPFWDEQHCGKRETFTDTLEIWRRHRDGSVEGYGR